MRIDEAIENAVTFLESLGYTSGDIHDDLQLTLRRLRTKHRRIAEEEL